ncbi:TPA: D-glycerate dehydrogenase, partial [Candidatus Acetothermia bacterium]|nr:D-glycerate dehydrogenase [Candidatus Acetothermia bacterium]
GLIGEPAFRKMKRDAFLVNTARGGIVDERALVRALRDRTIAGAALDVYAEEPPTDEELKGLDNVVLTPHMGAHTLEATSNMGRQAARNLIDALRGTLDPDVVVNKELLKGRR